MSDNGQQLDADREKNAGGLGALPKDVRARLNGQLEGRTIIAWSEFDLDSSNRFQRQFAVLTEDGLIVDSSANLPLSQIEEAKIVEGIGVDRIVVRSQGRVSAEMRYSRRHRRGMSKLHRKLERRLPKKDPAEVPPEWLEAVEREAEKSEHCAKCGKLIPAYAHGVCPRCLQQRKILWRLLDVGKPYRRQIVIALILTFILAGLGAVPAVLQGRLVDQAIDPKQLSGALQGATPFRLSVSERLNYLILLSIATVVALILMELVAMVRVRLLARVGTSVTRDLRHAVYAHLHELSLRFFAKRRTGSLITRVTNDTDRLWDFIVFGSVNLIRDVTMIIAIAIVMFWMNWKLAAVSLLPLPILAYVTYHRAMKMQRMFGRLWTYWSRLTGVVGDALPGIKVVKAFANEQHEIDRFDRRSNEYTEKELEVNEVWVRLQPIISGTMRIGGLLVWVVGGYLVITDPLHNSLGTLVTFNLFLWQFYNPIMELANSNRMVTRAATSAQRVFEVLDTAPEIYSKTGALTKDRLEGSVEFKQVSFSYEGTAPALREVSLKVDVGEMIGLCGPSGAGKSTFVNLICRFYDVTDGQILIDGVDIREYDVKWLRRQVGIVLQEPHLFHGTVADNIRYGHPEATEDLIIAAAKAANAHDFIVGFPDGYDTMVGERGQSLSGGERQRISIARAILDNPRILILDEATSSVDTETEKQIQQALDRLVSGRTTFAIAHRLSTLTAADRLVVLEKGRIAEEGVHTDLVNKEDGVYAKLHKTQVEMSSLVAIR